VLGALALSLAALSLAGVPAARAAAPSSPVLHITGMTFVGSKGSQREMVVRSRSAELRTDEGVARLEGVEALVSDPNDAQRRFTLRCDRAEFHLDSNDFLAEGDVQGETSDGQRYEAPWVRYDNDAGLLSTDAAVRVEDASGTFRGDGFRYHLKERRFELLGNVRVEQTQ
jgi:LPS export ABC transporter protein LptC